MQFLAPLAWLAAAAVAIPLLLHLTRRQVKRPMPFASLMFLRRIPAHETRRRKLHHLLLLALRCLGLLLLVVAFSRPVIDQLSLASITPEARQSVVLLIDNSLSMSRDGIWENALENARQRLGSAQPGDEFALIQFSNRAELISPWSSDHAAVAARLDEGIEPSYEATSFSEGLRLAADQMEEAQNVIRKIVLITDLQQSGLDLAEAADLSLPTGVEIELIDVEGSTANLYIDRVRLQRDVFGERYPFSVVVRIAAGQDSESARFEGEDYEVRLMLGDELIDRQSGELGEGRTAMARFEPFEVPEGITRGKLVLQSSDAISADDSFHFVVERAPAFRVGLVSENPEESAFLEEALASGTNLPFRLERVSGIASVDADEIPVLILSDLNRPRDTRALESYLDQGGGVIVTLGNEVQAESYNQNPESLLPGRLQEKVFARSAGSPFLNVTEVEGEHPVFDSFRTSGTNAMSAVQFYGYWKVNPAEETRVLARFGSGDPALIEAGTGRGRLLVFTSSLGRVWSDFPIHPVYVPFWQRMVLYASSWHSEPSAYYVSDVYSLDQIQSGEGAESGRRWDLLDPHGQRVFALGEEGEPSILLEVPGHYEMRRERTTNWVAVNVAPGESELSTVNRDEFLAALRSLRHRGELAAGTAGNIRQASGPENVWWLFILAALMVFAIESWVANRASRRGRPSTGRNSV